MRSLGIGQLRSLKNMSRISVVISSDSGRWRRFFEIPASKCVISGSIDLLLKEDEEGNILQAEIIDFKDYGRRRTT